MSKVNPKCSHCEDPAKHRFEEELLCTPCFLDACQQVTLRDIVAEANKDRSLLTKREEREIDADTRRTYQTIVLECANVDPFGPESLRRLQ